MNIIFLTLSDCTQITKPGIYTDLIRKFRTEGHNIYVVTPLERRKGEKTTLINELGINILGVRVFNVKKSNFLEKGLGYLFLEFQYKKAVKKYFDHVNFDLILYSTPPITLASTIKYIKLKNPNALSYLLLKDIFPQNAIDLGLISQYSLLHKFFRSKEIALYKLSDKIGCMSSANVDYLIKHNPYLCRNNIEVAPNSIDINSYCEIDKNLIIQKYNIPIDKTLFIYGGNLGKPQGIDFLIKCLNANKDRLDCYFLIVGSGTEFSKIQSWIRTYNPSNIALISSLPQEDYDMLLQIFHIGMIFLDYRFTIPNFPSRILSYLAYKMPVIIATDPNTDIGSIAEKNEFGKACLSNDVHQFTSIVNFYIQNPESRKLMGEIGYVYLKNNFLVEHTYKTIIKHLV